MHALPPDIERASGPRLTGVTCPDCAGAIEVRREGRGTLRFICRVEHTLSVDEMLTGKEERIEANLWATVRELEELAALLQDLERYAAVHGRSQTGGPHDGRIAQAHDHIQKLRRVISETRPVELARIGDGGAQDAAARVGADPT